MILSTIYNVIDMTIFDDLAQQAISACIDSFQRASEAIGVNGSKIDCQIFLISNLLTLREQLAPFSLELRQVDKHLDFSNTSKALRSFLANRSRLFNLTSDNALLNLSTEIVPTVEESTVDKKEELDAALRRVCNSMCEEVGQEVMGKLGEEGTTIQDLDVSHLQAVRDKVTTHLQQVFLKKLLAKLNTDTVRVLLAPIQRKIIKIAQDLKSGCKEDDSSDKGEALEEIIAAVRSI